MSERALVVRQRLELAQLAGCHRPSGRGLEVDDILVVETLPGAGRRGSEAS
jgi:hypothetical protein